MHPSRAFKAAGLSDSSGGNRQNTSMMSRAVNKDVSCVVHLYHDAADSAHLDLHLESIASSHRGTKFLRVSGRVALIINPEIVAQQPPLKRLDPNTDVPALVAVRDGSVVTTTPLSDLCEGDTLDPLALKQWLSQTGVLSTSPPPMEELCRIRPEELALYESGFYKGGDAGLEQRRADGLMPRRSAEASKVRKEEEFYECGVEGCQKSFHHEHVGVSNEMQSGLLVKE